MSFFARLVSRASLFTIWCHAWVNVKKAENTTNQRPKENILTCDAAFNEQHVAAGRNFKSWRRRIKVMLAKRCYSTLSPVPISTLGKESSQGNGTDMLPIPRVPLKIATTGVYRVGTRLSKLVFTNELLDM